MVAIARIERNKASRNRLKILGTSIQKLDLSTSYGSCNKSIQPFLKEVFLNNNNNNNNNTFFVAPQVMLYENKCARIAVVKCILKPPKKNQLVKKLKFLAHTFSNHHITSGGLTRRGYRSHSLSEMKRYRVARVDIPIMYKKHYQQ